MLVFSVRADPQPLPDLDPTDLAQLIAEWVLRLLRNAAIRNFRTQICKILHIEIELLTDPAMHDDPYLSFSALPGIFIEAHQDLKL